MSERLPDDAGGRPDYDRKAEVEAILAEDDTMLGKTWRYLQEGLSAQEMQEREGTTSAGVPQVEGTAAGP